MVIGDFLAFGDIKRLPFDIFAMFLSKHYETLSGRVRHRWALGAHVIWNRERKTMSNTATIILADRLLPLLCGTGADSEVEKIAPGRYIFNSEATTSKTAVTAADVVAGVLNWAAETLDDMAADHVHVNVARALLASHFDDISDLGGQLDDQARLGIQDRMQRSAARSGKLATLHRPSAPSDVAVTA